MMSSSSNNDNKIANFFTIDRYVSDDFCFDSDKYKTEIQSDELPLLSRKVRIITKFNKNDNQTSFITKKFIIPEKCIDNTGLISSGNQLPLIVEINFHFNVALADEIQNSSLDKLPCASLEVEKQILTPKTVLIEQQHSNLPNKPQEMPSIPEQHQQGKARMPDQQQPGISDFPVRSDLKEDNEKRCFCC